MQPVDYTINIPTPLEAQAQGFQLGAAEQQQQAQVQARQQALVQQQQMQADLAALASKPNPTGQDYAAVMTRYPQLADHFKKSWDVLNGAQQQTQLDQASQVYSAVLSGQPQVASKMLRDQAVAQRNSGQEQQAKAAETMAQWVDLHPESAKTTVGLALAAKLGPEKFGSTFATLGDQSRAAEKQPLELQKTNAEISNISSQIENRAGQLALDQDKLRSDVQLKLYELGQKANTLTDDAKKIINDSTIASVAADQSAAQMLSMADRLEKTDPSSGLYAKGQELYKSATGNQDAITQLRQEYTRLRSKQVLANLPQGPASDKDVAFAAKGFPDETADAKSMAQFVRGMAKIQQAGSALDAAQAEWVNSVGHMGKPKTDIEIEGVKVPAGSTFTDFSKQYLKKLTDKRATEQQAEAGARQVQSRSYMRFAQPGAQ
jgi:hypothetical protein